MNFLQESVLRRYFAFLLLFLAFANCKCKLDTRTVKIS